jgi:4-aminobutyrate aminotransferase-like enzyme
MQKRNLFACIGDVRGLGAMVAMELVEDRVSKRPASQLTRDLIAGCQERGLVLLNCGIHGNVIRFLVPLTAATTLVEEGLDIIEAVLGDLVRNHAERGIATA